LGNHKKKQEPIAEAHNVPYILANVASRAGGMFHKNRQAKLGCGLSRMPLASDCLLSRMNTMILWFGMVLKRIRI